MPHCHRIISFNNNGTSQIHEKKKQRVLQKSHQSPVNYIKLANS